MLFWPAMDYGYQQTANALFGRWRSGLQLRLSLVIAPWALLLLFYFLRRLGKQGEMVGQISGVVLAAVAVLRYEQLNDWAVRLFGIGSRRVDPDRPGSPGRRRLVALLRFAGAWRRIRPRSGGQARRCVDKRRRARAFAAQRRVATRRLRLGTEIRAIRPRTSRRPPMLTVYDAADGVLIKREGPAPITQRRCGSTC